MSAVNISGVGPFATNKLNAEGKPNPHYVEQFDCITLEDIAAMLDAPTRANKESARWVIFSSHQSRSHDEQRQQGTYSALWADIDHAPASLDYETLCGLLGAILGDYEHFAYQTSGWTAESPSYRVIVPLAATVNGQTFIHSQTVFNDMLAMVGIEGDRATQRPGQICYLPNVKPENNADLYRAGRYGSARLNVASDWSVQLAEMVEREKAEATRLAELAEQSRIKAAERVASGQLSPIQAFNEAYPIELLFQQYGYTKRGKGWNSPIQTSKSAAVSVLDGKWFSHSGSDKEAGIGNSAAKGDGCFGDAFDLFLFFEHRNDMSSALRQLGSMFTNEKGQTITEANQEAYRAARQSDPSKVFIPAPTMANLPKGETVTVKQSYQFMGIDDMIRHFEGCVYVASVNAVLTPNGDLLNKAKFEAMYGGFDFQFTNGTADSKTVKSAWDAFTINQAVEWRKAFRLHFAPCSPEQWLMRDGVWHYNAYTPTPGERVKGDAGPFIRHVEKLVPDANDRNILLSWCAHVVQNPGIKPNWAVLLVGTEGNGKSLLGECMTRAIGERWVTRPDASSLGERFNGWVMNKLLAVVEEVHVRGKMELMDRLKPMISDKRISVELKGIDSMGVSNCCAFFMCSNHKDAIVATEGGRRYAIFYTAQQSKAEKIDCGMTESYFDGLWDWLENQNGFAIVSEYLATYPVAFNMLADAPDTTSKKEAIAESMSPVAQVLLEAVDLEEYGFRGGLISSVELRKTLEARGFRKISPKTMAKAYEDCGYVPHPALSGSDGKMKMGATRPRIYVKKGHPAESIATSELVRDHFVKLNQGLPPYDPASVFYPGSQV